MSEFSPADFIRESNRIEGVIREPTDAELAEYERFMKLDGISTADLACFVNIYQPGAELRYRHGMNVRVGNHYPPPGGPQIVSRLERILDSANWHHARGTPKLAYVLHHQYETLHPFTDGNGRSGRMLWMWLMRKAPLGFLHTWYYQSLQFERSGEIDVSGGNTAPTPPPGAPAAAPDRKGTE